MAIYSIRCYQKTGFNAVNIPDTPALLDSGLFLWSDFVPLDILQERFLDTVRIRATWDQVKDIDYCHIYDSTDVSGEKSFFYMIDGVAMSSPDVAVLSLIPDFVTTAGGLEKLEILDGVLERCHVDTDNYGEWCVDDEYLSPGEPLVLDTHNISFSNATYDVVESSIDLGVMSSLYSAKHYIASEDDAVDVPASYPVLQETSFQIDGNASTNQRTGVVRIGQGVVRAGIEMCRALGIESAVIATASIPTALVSLTEETESISEVQISSVDHVRNQCGTMQRTWPAVDVNFNPYPGDGTSKSVSWSAVHWMEGNFVTRDTTFRFEYATVKNKRVLYGGCNKVGLLTTAGNRVESNPEDLTGGSRATIHIKSVGDPHLNGCPYHRFEYMNGNGTNAGFWINAVKGLQWRQIPLMYTDKSGSVLDRINFENSREISEMEYGYTFAGMLDKFIGSIGGGKGEAGSFAAGISGVAGGIGASGGIASLFGGGGAATAGGTAAVGAIAAPTAAAAVGFGAAAAGGLYAYNKASKSYEVARRQEMQQFAISQRVVSPTVNFTYDGEAFRDFYGETVICYRYRPTTNDLNRMDKLLTMYGYSVVMPAVDANLHNRQYFNYIRGNLTVGGNLPKWLADGISVQVSGGVRIWHTKPSNTYYSNNPIVV